VKHIADIKWRSGLTLREISRMTPDELLCHFDEWSKQATSESVRPSHPTTPVRSRKGFEG